MRKAILSIMVCLSATTLLAQGNKVETDTTTFKGYFLNKEYNVYLKIDFYKSNITVPFQKIYGELPGYFGDCQDGRKWLFTSAEIISPTKASIEVINDYGSEDLTATLTKVNDSTFVLRQEDGSTIKIARNRKWVKMPKTLTFMKTKE